jgi:histidyl-tRNA synthetase
MSDRPPSNKPSPPARVSIAAPTGTRDLYPVELARRRWIEDQWRKVAVRHGFEEIDGPTFEQSELYSVKSGQGILNELFQTFSGKDPEQAKAAGAGQAPFALRPEFTPTLARMFAARAGNLPKPCKWFWQGPCFRAERPQRGRLREFWQWNCDVIGGSFGPDEPENSERAGLDAEVLAACAELLVLCGLGPESIKLRINDRAAAARLIASCGGAGREHEALVLLDRRAKSHPPEWAQQFAALGIDLARFDAEARAVSFDSPGFASLGQQIRGAGLEAWCVVDPNIARGLAYYTGMVFEVIVDGERAVAGGGRYDNLIELFGGPPTPACGFGMGDVVLSLVLQDKKLMPSDKEIARALGLRPDVFVISNGAPENDAALPGVLAGLRRAGLHARRSYKASKNIGKLLKDASDQGSLYAVILEDAGEVSVKDLDQNKQRDGRVRLEDLLAKPREVLPPGGLG